MTRRPSSTRRKNTGRSGEAKRSRTRGPHHSRALRSALILFLLTIGSLVGAAAAFTDTFGHLPIPEYPRVMLTCLAAGAVLGTWTLVFGALCLRHTKPGNGFSLAVLILALVSSAAAAGYAWTIA